MKILTWNINGVRAVQRDKNKTNLKTILDSLGADVICLQETKVTRDMLDEPTAIVDGYESYFSYSRKRSGYSGTANYCTMEALPVKAEEGLTDKLTTPNDTCVYQYGNVNVFSDEELQALDDEGRCVITQHRIRLSTGEEKQVAIINVYVPRAGDREDRHKYKLQFLTLLQIRAEALLKSGIHVIILGDINTCHRQIDNCDPDEEYFRKSSRIWLNRLLQQKERDKNIPLTDANLSEVASLCGFDDGNFSDVFRQQHPLQEHAFTNWCTLTGARQTNYGRRLDYILIDTELAESVTHCEIMADFEGSDHCPVIVTLNCTPISSSQSPLLCSKFMPEFKGQQKKLSSFFTKITKPVQISENHKSSRTKDQHFNFSKKEECIPSAIENENSNSQKTQSVGGLKRYATVEVDKRKSSSSKKIKFKKGTSASDSKQISLTSFFSQRTSDTNSNKSQNSQTQNKSIGSVSSIKINASTIITNPPPVIDCFVIEDDDDDNNQYDRNPANTESHQPFGSHEEKSHTSIGNESDSNTNTNIHASDRSKVNRETHSKRTTPISIINSVTVEKSLSNSISNSSSAKSPNKSQTSAASAWKGLLGGLPPPPLCPGHKEACVLRKVKKAGPNQNKQFYVCAHPDGAPGNPNSRCEFFQWLTMKK